MHRPHARTFRLLSVAALGLLSIAAVGRADEKELLSRFKESFGATDPAARADAVKTLAEESRSLPDGGTSDRIAFALAKGLVDKELEVPAQTIFAYANRRDVNTVIGALDAFLREQLEQAARKVESSDPYARNFVDRALCLIENGSYVLANYKDDRAALTLIPMLASLKGDTKKNDLGSRLIGPLATAVLELGTEGAVEAAVKQTKTFKLPVQAAGARKLHDALAEFATKKGMTPPDMGEKYSEQWHTWFEANRNQLPKKLGILEKPPTSDPCRPLRGLPGKAG